MVVSNTVRQFIRQGIFFIVQKYELDPLDRIHMRQELSPNAVKLWRRLSNKMGPRVGSNQGLYSPSRKTYNRKIPRDCML